MRSLFFIIFSLAVMPFSSFSQINDRHEFKCASVSEYIYKSAFKNDPVIERLVDLRESDEAKESYFIIKLYDGRGVFEGSANGTIITPLSFYYPDATIVQKKENKFFAGNIRFNTPTLGGANLIINTGTLQYEDTRGGSIFTLRYDPDKSIAYAAYNEVAPSLDIKTITMQCDIPFKKWENMMNFLFTL